MPLLTLVLPRGLYEPIQFVVITVIFVLHAGSSGFPMMTDPICTTRLKNGKQDFEAYSSLMTGLGKERIMAVGWARDGAVQDQIDDSVKDAVKEARRRLPDGESLTHCAQCEAPIPEARRRAIPGVRLCIDCQTALEEQQTAFTGINRRGSKDSQLK